MKSPDAPIAKKGFFITHFLTVKDQARSKEIFLGILGGESREAGKSMLHQAGKFLDYSQLGRRAHARQARSNSGDTAEFEPREQFLKPEGRGHTGLLQEMERERSAFSDRTAGQSRPRMEMLHAGPGWLLNRDRRVFADVAASRAGGRFELFTVGDFPYAGKTCIPRKEFFNAVDGVI